MPQSANIAVTTVATVHTAIDRRNVLLEDK